MTETQIIALLVGSTILGLLAVVIRFVIEWRETANRKRVIEDALRYGIGIVRSGKRIHPLDFYQPPSQECGKEKA